LDSRDLNERERTINVASTDRLPVIDQKESFAENKDSFI